MQNEKYPILIEKLNSFKQQKHRNAHDMFSCLNVLISKINALGVKGIVDDEYNRKIIQALRKLEYNMITSLFFMRKSLMR